MSAKRLLKTVIRLNSSHIINASKQLKLNLKICIFWQMRWDSRV